jgi:hypothetical protein
MDKDRLDFLKLTDDLLQVLISRKKEGLNHLFSKHGIPSLRHCQSQLQLAESGWNKLSFNYHVGATFLRFVNTAGRHESILKETSRSLLHLHTVLQGISDLCSTGRLGKDAIEVTVKIQQIISWMRPLEHMLAEVEKHPTP